MAFGAKSKRTLAMYVIAALGLSWLPFGVGSAVQNLVNTQLPVGGLSVANVLGILGVYVAYMMFNKDF